MSYKIIPTPEFAKQAKKLAKRYPKLSDDLSLLQSILLENPKSGTHLGNNCYKLRLQNSSTQKGKSGGFRIIFFIIEKNLIIRLLSIYSKSEKDSIKDEEINKILEKNNLL